MKQLGFEDEYIELMVSTAYDIPSLIALNDLPFVENSIVRKIINMYMDEAVEYIHNVIRLEPLSYKALAEDAYALCSNKSLVYIGRFVGGAIPAHELYAQYMGLCKSKVFLHSHPIPLPIPSPEDIMSAHQINYEVECVISKISKHRAMMTCVKPVNSWDNVVEAYNKLSERILGVSNFIVVGGKDNIMFLPYPSLKEVNEIVSYSKQLISPYATIVHIDVDLLNRVYNVVEAD